MTQPVVEQPSEASELLERLRRKVDSGQRTVGGGSISSDGKTEMRGCEPIMVFRNPDGPKAADLIEAVIAERDEARAAKDDAINLMLSDQQRALAAEAALRTAEAERDKMADIARELECWVTAALECKDWHWDGDQHVAATQSRDTARAALATTGKSEAA